MKHIVLGVIVLTEVLGQLQFLGVIVLTVEIIPREKCRFCKVYLAKGCLNDICLECCKKRIVNSGSSE